MPAVQVEMTGERLQEITEPLSKAINQAQFNGFTIDEVLVAMMVMLGSAIKQRGATLLIDAPVREALPPIALGYEMGIDDALAVPRLGNRK